MIAHRKSYKRREFIVTIAELRALFAMYAGSADSYEVKRTLRLHGWSQPDAEALVEAARRACRQVGRWPDVYAELQFRNPAS
jgi:hypothetical protein